MSEKSFGAFVLQAAKAGAEKAQALAIYVRSRGATWQDVRKEIGRAHGSGSIAAKYAILKKCKPVVTAMRRAKLIA
jgi:hypothetical protein